MARIARKAGRTTATVATTDPAPEYRYHRVSPAEHHKAYLEER